MEHSVRMTESLEPRGAWTADRCTIARALEVIPTRSAFLRLRESDNQLPGAAGLVRVGSVTYRTKEGSGDERRLPRALLGRLPRPPAQPPHDGVSNLHGDPDRDRARDDRRL